MAEKQYSLVYYADKGGAFIKNNETGTEWYHDSRASLLEIVDELNELHEENEQSKMMIATLRNIVLDQEDLEKENKEIKLQYDNLEAQRDEFYRGARENANRVRQLKKENQQLKENVSRLINEAIVEILDGQRYEGERILNKALELLE